MYEDYRPDKGLTFNKHFSKFGYKQIVPCKRCIGCRLDYSRQWAVRSMCEAQTHDTNSFITLTYNDENLPDNGNLIKEHFQKFIKSLRKRTGLPIRYYMCGEYGSQTHRPHYHALIFGFNFPDKLLHARRRSLNVYTSDLLKKAWPHGFHEIGNLTFQSAAYCARYIMKKQYGDQAIETYGTKTDPVTKKKTYEKQPEYTQMSLSPGIGREFYNRYRSDLFPSDNITFNGKTYPAPDYFRALLKIDDPVMWQQIKDARIAKIKAIPIKEKSPKRLATKEICQLAKLKSLKREL